jgi:DNA-binding CsgD family transcriptional regulator
MATVQGDPEQAELLAEEAVAVSRVLGEPKGLAMAVFALGRITQRQGDRERSRLLTEESLELFRVAGDRLGMACSLGGLGMLAYEQDEYEQAATLYEEAQAVYRSLADRYGIGWSLQYLGLAALGAGDHQRATALLAESLTIRHEIGDLEGMAGCLEGLAVIAVDRAQLPRAARMLAAADGMRQVTGTPVPLNEHACHQRTLAVVQAGLGADELAAAWAAGQALTPDQALAEALAAEEPAPPAIITPVRAPANRTARPPVSAPAGGLSRRECDVAVLMAQGYTNRRIAERLIISEWTVDTHVRHILTKLDLRSRAQVAAWVTMQGLTEAHAV